MEDWQNRVNVEKLDLKEKIFKLQNFLSLPSNEDPLLIEQLQIMKKYEAVLIQRIKLFK